MLSVFRAISALLSAVVLFGLANGLFFTLLGIRMSADGVSTGMIGLVGSAFFAGMLAGTLFCERVIRRVGHIRAFTVFGAVLAAAALMHPLIPEIEMWIGLRFVMGFAMAGYFMIVESWLQYESTGQTRGRTFALYILAHTAGVGLGPLAIDRAQGRKSADRHADCKGADHGDRRQGEQVADAKTARFPQGRVAQGGQGDWQERDGIEYRGHREQLVA